MKTMKRVIEEGYLPNKLVRAVVRQLGGGQDAMKNLQDVYNHGASGGFHGFSYHADTVKFYKRHRKEIVEVAEIMADDLGENLIEMVMRFGCFKGYVHDRNFHREVGQTLYGVPVDTEVANAMSWFTLEEVARAFCDE